MLVVVVFMLAILMLSLIVAAPLVKKDIQRDREIETMHRGKQYARAVKLYYKKFGAYPPNVDALVNTNEIRFLRKKYVDPTTGKEDWKIIRFGQQKTQTLGFFGQPLAGAATPLAGTGLTGGVPGLGGSNTGGITSSIGGTGSISTSSSTDPGTNPTAPTGTDPASTNAGSIDPNAANGSTGSGTTSTGLTGQSFGGGGIIGFSPNSPKQSILVYKKKNHYNEWEFIYDPLADQMMMQGGNLGMIGQPASGTTTPVGSPTALTPSPSPTPPAPQPQ